MHPTAVTHLWLIPALPLLGAVINGLFGYPLQKRFGRSPVNLIACGTVLLSFLLSVYTFFQLLGVEPRLLSTKVWTWFQVGDLSVDFAFMVDPLTAVMILVVTGVSFLIHVYSTGYMSHDPGHYRYFAYLNLFVFAMLTLVMGDNLLRRSSPTASATSASSSEPSRSSGPCSGMASRRSTSTRCARSPSFWPTTRSGGSISSPS
jgi:hypothetical protein